VVAGRVRKERWMGRSSCPLACRVSGFSYVITAVEKRLCDRLYDRKQQCDDVWIFEARTLSAFGPLPHAKGSRVGASALDAT
jgi:hypothetical protein